MCLNIPTRIYTYIYLQTYIHPLTFKENVFSRIFWRGRREIRALEPGANYQVPRAPSDRIPKHDNNLKVRV